MLGVIASHYAASGGGTPGSGVYAAEVMADSPWLYWRLGEASGTIAVDSSGNGRNGAYVGAPALGTTGLVSGTDTAVTFASGKYAERAAEGTPAALTVEAWIKPSTVPGNGTIIAHADTNWAFGDRWAFLIAQQGTGFEAGVFQGGIYRQIVTSGNLVAGNAYHVALAADSTATRLLLNGAQIGSTTGATTGVNPAATIPLTVGAGVQGGSRPSPFSGVIDEVAIYSTALSTARIAAHYAAGTA